MTHEKQKGAAKTARSFGTRTIPIVPAEALKKPAWIRVRSGAGTARFGEIKKILREQALHTVCEEASCPNIGECFSKGTATFMILGDLCTRRCPFCDVGHGKPLAPDPDEPRNLAHTVTSLDLRYVVITSVDRDDLRDGGAAHFAECISQLRTHAPHTTLEILVPDFRGRLETALDHLGTALPDVLNHNLETVPRLYPEARPGADYQHSLKLLSTFKQRFPGIATKSGLMLGLGETDEEILTVLNDLRSHDVDMITIGQYLAPSGHHLPVRRYAHPDIFDMLGRKASEMGFAHVASAPLVRSSYHADRQAQDAGLAVNVIGKNDWVSTITPTSPDDMGNPPSTDSV